MTPAELGAALREGEGGDLARRRAIVTLSLAAIAALGITALYQVGVIRHVPEPPIPGFDADRVNGSPDAYALLETPDGALGIGSYAATLALAAMGPPDRADSQPWIPLAMAAKVTFDAAQAARLTLNEATKQHALCAWCLVTSGATLATIPLVVPEAWKAARTLLGKR